MQVQSYNRWILIGFEWLSDESIRRDVLITINQSICFKEPSITTRILKPMLYNVCVSELTFGALGRGFPTLLRRGTAKHTVDEVRHQGCHYGNLEERQRHH